MLKFKIFIDLKKIKITFHLEDPPRNKSFLLILNQLINLYIHDAPFIIKSTLHNWHLKQICIWELTKIWLKAFVRCVCVCAGILNLIKMPLYNHWIIMVIKKNYYVNNLILLTLKNNFICSKSSFIFWCFFSNFSTRWNTWVILNIYFTLFPNTAITCWIKRNDKISSMNRIRN